MGEEADTRNPDCGCGCGQEVSRPWNKYLLGHSCKAKVSREQMLEIGALLEQGVSFKKIGAMYGVTNGAISKYKWAMSKKSLARRNVLAETRYIPVEARRVVRKKEINDYNDYMREKRDIWKAMRALEAVNRALRNPFGVGNSPKNVRRRTAPTPSTTPTGSTVNNTASSSESKEK